MRAFAYVLLSTAVLSAAQTGAPTNSPAAAKPPAAMATYQNAALHLTYSYPTTYSDASAIVSAAIQASVSNLSDPKSEAHCIATPFSVMKPGKDGLAVVALAQADGGCLHKNLTAADLPRFSRGQVQGLTASGARTQFDPPITYTVEGHPALLTEGTFQLPTGQTLHSAFACVLLTPDIGCWQFLASTGEALAAMSAFPISLDGKPAEALVPPALLGKP